MKTMKTQKKTQRVRGKTQLKDSELIASGRASQDETGVAKQFILLWHVPGPGEPKPYGHALADPAGNEYPCMNTQGAREIMVTGRHLDAGRPGSLS